MRRDVIKARAVEQSLGDLATVCPTITNGVFFAVPPELVRGRHSLSREQVTAVHRERLMISATELLSKGGYRGTGVREICAHGGISRAAFYTCFDDKDACIFAAYDRFISVLFERLVTLSATQSSGNIDISDIIENYLGALQLDLVCARAFLVEMDSLGREARDRRRLGVVRLATLMRKRAAPAVGRPLGAYIVGVYALRQLVSDALDESDAPDLLTLLPAAVRWARRMLAD